ncbi:MAG TPA: ankyrin repeat domain-containing protein [Patescibacteria group bacterium]|nr:ankyrin repeat domain-containing protein [Patescibacteria group bacterium]
MPDSSLEKRKPTLADQHWRATLRSRRAEQLNADMVSALEQGDSWRFRMLMQVPAQWSRNDEILRMAVKHGRLDMLLELVKNDPEWTDKANMHRLGEIAAENGHTGVVRHLVEECGLDVHYYSEEMLRVAVKKGHADVVRFLLSKEADPTVWTNEPIRDAAENGHLEIVRLLLDAGADINAHNYHGSVLCLAVSSANKELVEFLLDRGADISAEGFSAFVRAGAEGRLDMLQLFLDRKVDANAKNGEAFISAIINHHTDAAELLLAQGADVNAQGGKALRHAAGQGMTEEAEFLLRHRANPNAYEYRETPLTEAVRNNNGSMVRLLMKHGADHTTLQGEAWSIARRNRSRPMLRAIVEGFRAQLAETRHAKFDEFNRSFTGSYSLDDLRGKRGDSGETGLVIAAQTGKFSELVRRATAGKLTGDDLYHPDDSIDTVFSHLQRHKALQDFFAPALWADRPYEVKDVISQLPEPCQKRIQLGPIANELNYRELRKKAANSAPALKPPKK